MEQKAFKLDMVCKTAPFSGLIDNSQMFGKEFLKDWYKKMAFYFFKNYISDVSFLGKIITDDLEFDDLLDVKGLK